MAIQWGAWRYGGGNGMRVGISVSWEAISSGEAVASCTVRYYTQNQYSYSDSQTLDYGGALGGTHNYQNNQGGGAVLRATRTYNYTYPSNSYGSSPGNVTFSVNVDGTYNGVNPSKSVTTSIPARPYAAPTPPSSVTASRVSDSQINLSWVRNATSQRPYSSQTIQMRTYDGTGWSAWTTVITASGAATSYARTGLSTNRVYDFQIRANNSAGSSGYAGSNRVYMRPAAPSNVKASVSTDGASIKVTWVNNHYAGSSVPQVDIERQVNGGAWSAVATNLAYNTVQWVDTSPGAGTNRYRVRSQLGSAHDSLASSWVNSNTVSTIVPPLAPTNLTPNGVSRDLTYDLTLRWQHNDGGDGSEQSHYRVQYSTDGGASWAILPGAGNITSSVSEHTIPGGQLANGVTYSFRVQTQGSTTVGYGPYGAASTVNAVDQPVVTLTGPGPLINSGPIVAEWEYTQPQGHPQTGWLAYLLDEDGSILETLTGDDAAGSAEFTSPVEDGKTYTVRVSARSADGLWAEAVEVTTTVDLLPPVEPSVTGTYFECSGAVQLTITADASVPGETMDIDYVDVQRSIDGGPWVTIAEQLDVTDESVVEVYSEDFEVDEGGWAGLAVEGYNAPAAVARSTQYPSTGVGSLGIEWGAGPTGEFAGIGMTGMTPGQAYTLVLKALVTGPGDVRLAVPAADAEGSTIEPTVGFGDGPFGSGAFGSGFGGWATTTLTFIAPSDTFDMGVLNLNPQAGSEVWIDHVVLYEGVTSGYEGGSIALGVVDPIPSTTGQNAYRVIAYASNGSAAVSELEVVQGTDGQIGSGFWAFLAYGDSFAQVLRVRGDLKVSAATSRTRAAHHYQGRRLPVLMVGEQVDRSVKVSGTLYYDDLCPMVDDDCRHDSPRDEWEQASWEATVVCYRDHTGRRIFGMLGALDTDDVYPGMAGLSFSVAETSYAEQLGSAPPIAEEVI